MLKKNGVGVVIHFRGCELRNREQNMALDPEFNICEACDYDMHCVSDAMKRKRKQARKYGDAFLVTTPDLIDFFPGSTHVPFFVPEVGDYPVKDRKQENDEQIRILHATNHPGIDGTKEIRDVINKLKDKGYPIELTVLNGVSYNEVLEKLTGADISIGKMKMGYYANFQIESMLMGIPTITYVRPEFITDGLAESGFILCDLENLEATLEHYLDNLDELQAKKALAKSSILKLHDNEKIARQLISIYQSIKRDN
jgi:hypothetical protein